MKLSARNSKFYAALCGIVATALTAGFAHNALATGAASALTAIAVYLVPNTTPKDK